MILKILKPLLEVRPSTKHNWLVGSTNYKGATMYQMSSLFLYTLSFIHAFTQQTSTNYPLYVSITVLNFYDCSAEIIDHN